MLQILSTFKYKEIDVYTYLMIILKFILIRILKFFSFIKRAVKVEDLFVFNTWELQEKLSLLKATHKAFFK